MLRICWECSTRFAAGLLACPHCKSHNHEEWDGTMPKITKYGGPSHVAAGIGPDPDEETIVESAPDETPDETVEPGDGYDTMTKAELQYELEERELPTSGTKVELVDRLRGDGQE